MNALLKMAYDLREAAKDLEAKQDKSEIFLEDVSKEPSDIQAYRQILNTINNQKKLQNLNFLEVLIPQFKLIKNKDASSSYRNSLVKEVQEYLKNNLPKDSKQTVEPKFKVNDIINKLKTYRAKSLPKGVTRPALKLTEEVLNYLSVYGVQGLKRLMLPGAFWRNFNVGAEKRKIQEQKQ